MGNAGRRRPPSMDVHVRLNVCSMQDANRGRVVRGLGGRARPSGWPVAADGRCRAIGLSAA